MVQANTPGQRDGRVTFWIDGHLAADFPNLRFRSVDALKINRVNVGMGPPDPTALRPRRQTGS